ncbi:MAG: carboxylesterase family protein [Bacteroidetes bacterium]|nr:carboxylesterase family protein [Bacteroidota bacterium]
MRWLLITVTYFLLACAAEAQTNHCVANRYSEGYYFDSSDIEFTPNILYAVAERWPAATVDSLRLDVFAPKLTADSLSNRPLILLIHGGAFLTGNRQAMHYQCMEYARRGFVVATMTYRLGWNCAATDLLGVCLFCQGEQYKLKTATYRAAQDGRAAMRYLHAHAADFGIDTAWMFIGGESAGSITALHTAFWSQSEADSFASWAKGDVGLLDTAGNALPADYSIKAVIDNCGAVSRDSVVLNNGNVPVISFHDEGDCVVPNHAGQVISCTCQSFYWSWGSNSIHNILKNANTCTEMNLVPLSINHCSYPAWNLVRHASCFLKRMMCNDCRTDYSTDINKSVACDTLQATANSVIRFENESDFSVYPNPNHGVLHFDLSNLMHHPALEIAISNTAGEVVAQSASIQQPDFSIAVKNLPAGIYFIAVSSQQQTIAIRKLILEP